MMPFPCGYLPQRQLEAVIAEEIKQLFLYLFEVICKSLHVLG
jgi:hypothetical protein